MIEPIMYFGLGFLAATLLALIIMPFVHGRAERLTTRRLEAAIPVSMAEIQADKDQLRAEFAMSTRRLEMSVEQLKRKTTSQLAELGKKADAINQLGQAGMRRVELDYLEARIHFNHERWLDAARTLERVFPLFLRSYEQRKKDWFAFNLGLECNYLLGNCYEQLGDPYRAAMAYDRVVARDPFSVVGRLGRYSVIVGMTPSMGAAGYLIRRAAAARFCSLPVLDQEIDSAFNDFRLSLRVLELYPYAVVQDRETGTLVSFQQYPRGFRRKPSFWERVALPLRKRWRVLRLYGPRVALALELQKFRR